MGKKNRHKGRRNGKFKGKRSQTLLEMAQVGVGTPWIRVIDPASGRPYFYHCVTREVTWENPNAAETNTVADNTGASASASAAASVATQSGYNAGSETSNERSSAEARDPNTTNPSDEADEASILVRFLDNLDRSQYQKPAPINHITESGHPLRIKGISIKFPFAKPHAPQKVLMMKVCGGNERDVVHAKFSYYDSKNTHFQHYIHTKKYA